MELTQRGDQTNKSSNISRSLGAIYITWFCIFIIYFTSIQYGTVGGMIIPKSKTTGCAQLPVDLLKKILGPAFNGRYMSVNPPIQTGSDIESKKRTVNFNEPFAVDDKFFDDLDDSPAWEVTNHAELDIKNFDVRSKRYTTDFINPHQWHCKSKISWLDLGPDYFPRFLRSVECLGKTCWYGAYNCRPRSFTLKLLKRKRDECVWTSSIFPTGVRGLPKELAELWIWEERAVTFCCDCRL